MSRVLKRPMFRKGGEVMEGIMTGIKPRKMFSTAGLSKADQSIVGDVRRKMNLIDIISGSGASPLGDPLTQFLLTAGPDLVAGKAAGGTKLQEILGGIKPGLDRAIKTQQLKQAQNRKLATALVSKTGTGSFAQAYKNYGQYMTNPDTGKKYTEEEFRPVFGEMQIYRKKTNPDEVRRKEKQDIRTSLGKEKNFARNPKYNEIEKSLISTAISKIENNKSLLNSIDKENPYIQGSDYTVGTPKEINKQEVKVLIPNDKDDYVPNKVYFMIEENSFFVFNNDLGQLIQLPGI